MMEELLMMLYTYQSLRITRFDIMQGNTRIGDISIGICSVGAKCCPHTWVSVHVVGAPNTYTNDRNQMRVGDLGACTCPHCPISIAATGSPNVITEDRQTHRLGDIHIVPCGVGIVVTASTDTYSE